GNPAWAAGARRAYRRGLARNRLRKITRGRNAMSLGRLKNFVTTMTRIADTASDDDTWLRAARPVLAELVAVDDWLPDAYAVPDKQYYRQYLLHCDPLERFSVVSFVWGPGQLTPIHDHTVWGLIGMLRGEEISTPYRAGAGGGMNVSGEPTR